LIHWSAEVSGQWRNERESANAGVAESSSLLTIAIGGTRDIVPSPTVAEPAKLQVKGSGLISLRIATTSMDRTMCVVFNNGVTPIRNIAAKRGKRYKMTYPKKLWKLHWLSPLWFPLRYKIS
jgi:hypothetical protein